MNFNHLKYISYFLDNKKDFTIRFNKNNNLIIPSFGVMVSVPPIIRVKMNLKSVIDYVEKIILE